MLVPFTNSSNITPLWLPRAEIMEDASRSFNKTALKMALAVLVISATTTIFLALVLNHYIPLVTAQALSGKTFLIITLSIFGGLSAIGAILIRRMANNATDAIRKHYSPEPDSDSPKPKEFELFSEKKVDGNLTIGESETFDLQYFPIFFTSFCIGALVATVVALVLLQHNLEFAGIGILAWMGSSVASMIAISLSPIGRDRFKFHELLSAQEKERIETILKPAMEKKKRLEIILNPEMDVVVHAALMKFHAQLKLEEAKKGELHNPWMGFLDNQNKIIIYLKKEIGIPAALRNGLLPEADLKKFFKKMQEVQEVTYAKGALIEHLEEDSVVLGEGTIQLIMGFVFDHGIEIAAFNIASFYA